MLVFFSVVCKNGDWGCMLLVCMKCVNCTILFLIPSILSCSMFILCVLGVCSIIGRGGGGDMDWAGGGVWFLHVNFVSGEWVGYGSGCGWSLVSQA